MRIAAIACLSLTAAAAVIAELRIRASAPRRPPRGGAARAPHLTTGLTHELRERLRQTESVLRRSQRMDEQAQRLANVGFFEYVWSARRLCWSPRHAQWFGQRASVLGDALTLWRERVDPVQRERLFDELSRLVAAASHFGTIEFDLVEAGEVHSFESRFVIDYAVSGAPLRLLGVTIDISARRRAEIERTQLLARALESRLEAEAANRAKDEFLAMLGHELRNPLNAIAMSLHLLERAAPASPDALAARSIIERQAAKLTRMVDELLDAGRVIAGEIALQRRPLALAALVQRSVTEAQAGAAAKNQSITAHLAEVWIDADAQRVAQVTDRLLDNALRHSPPGATIDVRLHTEPGHAVLCVADNGSGIAPELLARIYEPFVQGARALDRPAGGLGLGLTLVKRLVELHGGSVQVRSSVDGSVFEVRLPALPCAADATPADADTAVGSAEAGAARLRCRICVIEDNTDARLGLSALLKLDGHAVRTAADGPSGLAQLLDERPDVALVDIGLPGLDGYEVARGSRAAGYRGRLIAVSGYGQVGDVQRALAAGFEAHLIKPIDFQRLRRLLEAA